MKLRLTPKVYTYDRYRCRHFHYHDRTYMCISGTRAQLERFSGFKPPNESVSFA